MELTTTKGSKQAVVNAFGGIENLVIHEVKTPTPKSSEVVIALTSIGMNQADLMARRGEYRLSSGAPPFIPGIEGGGTITAIGTDVKNRQVGQRVILSLSAPQGKGTYRSHFVAAATDTIPVPDSIPDHLIGALWLPFLTAWGALVWRQNLQAGQTVLLPAASSSVAIAASQIAKQRGAITIGTTTSPHKVNALKALDAAQYDHIVLTQRSEAAEKTNQEPWWRTVKKIAQQGAGHRESGHRGIDIIFDPVAAGSFLHHEIRLLAQGGTLWAYGLLGTPDTVDISPLIRKDAAIRGWLLNSIAGTDVEAKAYQHILENVSQGTYTLPVADIFELAQVREAQQAMEKGTHIGKYILVP
ncbi:MAG: zinc-binding dehydrogenase [Cyanobacteria bacterium J06631_9]